MKSVIQENIWTFAQHEDSFAARYGCGYRKTFLQHMNLSKLRERSMGVP